jgi:biotin carboxylase
MKTAIVDAYSTGRYLAPALHRHGAGTVHVQSDPGLPRFYLDTYEPGDFTAALVHDGDLRRTAEWLRGQGVDLIVAGSEPGVDLAERLAVRLGTPANGRDTPGARRDKALMAQLVRRAGLAAPDTRIFCTVRALVAYSKELDRWPLVVKPRDSAGSDNVVFCDDPEAVHSAGTRILAGRNLMGTENAAVIAQQFLDGDEYFVNTVSAGGRHHVAEVWRYHKVLLPGGGYLYDYEEPLPWTCPEAVTVREYVLAVLDALQVRHGPAHTEVMLTDRGPVLLETGARLAGTILPAVVARCFGTNHVELTALAYAAADRFAEICGQPYEMRGHLRYVSLICPHEAVLRGDDPFTALRSLPTYAGMLMSVPPGGAVRRTVDSATSPGVVYLHGTDSADLATDYAALRACERDGLYARGDPS